MGGLAYWLYRDRQRRKEEGWRRQKRSHITQTDEDSVKFKAAFLQKCAEAGLTIDATAYLADIVAEAMENAPDNPEELEKTAQSAIGGALGAFGGGVLSSLSPIAQVAAILGPFGLGAAGGAVLGSAVGETKARDLEEIRKEELIEAYRREAGRLRAHARRPVLRRQPILIVIH